MRIFSKQCDYYMEKHCYYEDKKAETFYDLYDLEDNFIGTFKEKNIRLYLGIEEDITTDDVVQFYEKYYY